MDECVLSMDKLLFMQYHVVIQVQSKKGIVHMKNTVKVGVIGLGGRGCSQTNLLIQMDDVEILWLCDLYEDRIKTMNDIMVKAGKPAPKTTTNYKDILGDKDVDAVFCFTPYWKCSPSRLSEMIYLYFVKHHTHRLKIQH